MPKMKSNRGASKRFRRSGSGNYKCAHSHLRHILTKKSRKRKRYLRGGSFVSSVDIRAVRRMLPN